MDSWGEEYGINDFVIGKITLKDTCYINVRINK